MATRYWVGGSGTWDTTSTTKWSATSGGASGASVPTSVDDVVFNAASGTTYTVTFASGIECRGLNITKPSGTVTFAGSSQQLAIYGGITVNSTSGITFTGVDWVFVGTSTTNTINLNGISLSGTQIRFSGSASTTKWTFQNNLTMSGAIALQDGILDFGTYTITCDSFKPGYLPFSTYGREVIFGAGSKVVVTGSGTQAVDCNFPTGLTLTGYANIELSSASDKTFAGGGLSWGGLLSYGGGALTVTGSNTFTDDFEILTASNVFFEASNTQTFVGSFSAVGTSGSGMFLGSTVSGTQATLSKASGTVSVVYAAIRDLNATGGALWEATASTDEGNNTGWIFPSGGSMMMFC